MHTVGVDWTLKHLWEHFYSAWPHNNEENDERKKQKVGRHDAWSGPTAHTDAFKWKIKISRHLQCPLPGHRNITACVLLPSTHRPNRPYVTSIETTPIKNKHYSFRFYQRKKKKKEKERERTGAGKKVRTQSASNWWPAADAVAIVRLANASLFVRLCSLCRRTFKPNVLQHNEP